MLGSVAAVSAFCGACSVGLSTGIAGGFGVSVTLIALGAASLCAALRQSKASALDFLSRFTNPQKVSTGLPSTKKT
ncbi:PGF-CTERM sorting domain-containing protein [Obesumbacterium proteus]|nr:PGF-CTERM sorting domain-containing protein [Obesumbacterium proteus]